MPRKSDERSSNQIVENIIDKVIVAKIFDADSDISTLIIKELSNGIDEVISIKQELGKLQKRMQLDLKEKIEKGEIENETTKTVKDVRLPHKPTIRTVKRF